MTVKGIGPWSMPYCPFNNRKIFDWLRRIRLLRLRRHTVSNRKIPGVWDSVEETVIFSGSMADTGYAPPENGAFWDSTRERFVFFSSREAESSTATAATVLSYPTLTVRDVSLNRVDTGEGLDETESDRASQSGRGPSIRYATRYALASLGRETANLQDEGEVGSDGESSIEDDDTGIEYESTLGAETPKATPNAAKYLSELQPVAVNDLPEDCRTCGICQEIYNTSDEPEQPYLVGRCGHILGRTCLSQWVMPEGRTPNKTCPLCRAVLFKDDTPDPSGAFDDANRELLLESIEQLLNEEEGLEEDEALLSDLLSGEDNALDEDEERLLDIHDELDEPETEDERYASAFLDAIFANTQALEVWDEVRGHQRERAGVGIAYPPYIFSEYVLTFFRRYVHRSNVGSSATISVGSSLRRLMGQLYDRLREDMERTAMPIVWTENGPPLSLLLDPATIPLVETVLERLVEIERQWYDADI